MRFLEAADHELVAHEFRWGQEGRDVRYPARDWTLFVLEADIHSASAEAWRLPALPGHEERGATGRLRRTLLPGITLDR